ncbi:MAG: MFS transporter [Candidatus Hermodarchaeota archaeon]
MVLRGVDSTCFFSGPPRQGESATALTIQGWTNNLFQPNYVTVWREVIPTTTLIVDRALTALSTICLDVEPILGTVRNPSITRFIFLFGLGFGGYWMIMTPALADVIDEIVVKTGRRNDGIFMGFRAFFGRFAFAVQGAVFFLVHELTGFVAGVSEQTPLALLGIHSHYGIIPAILLVIGVSGN